MWFLRRRVQVDRLPAGRVTVQFEFRDADKRCFWLVLHRPDVDLCLADPGFDTDLCVTTDVRTFTRVYLGHVSIVHALGKGSVTVAGRSDLRRAFGGRRDRDGGDLPAAGGRADHGGRARPQALPAVAQPSVPGRSPAPARWADPRARTSATSCRPTRGNGGGGQPAPPAPGATRPHGKRCHPPLRAHPETQGRVRCRPAWTPTASAPLVRTLLIRGSLLEALVVAVCERDDLHPGLQPTPAGRRRVAPEFAGGQPPPRDGGRAMWMIAAMQLRSQRHAAQSLNKTSVPGRPPPATGTRTAPGPRSRRRVRSSPARCSPAPARWPWRPRGA
jgi:hypothetical protein